MPVYDVRSEANASINELYFYWMLPKKVERIHSLLTFQMLSKRVPDGGETVFISCGRKNVLVGIHLHWNYVLIVRISSFSSTYASWEAASSLRVRI